MLASGASDGHVAFNPPGSSRENRTRIIPLSEETRRDNLQTFPAFGTLEVVPTHGISVGIDTITSAKESAMVVWGSGKRLTLTRMRSAERYEPEWPATVIHECVVRKGRMQLRRWSIRRASGSRSWPAVAFASTMCAM